VSVDVSIAYLVAGPVAVWVFYPEGAVDVGVWVDCVSHFIGPLGNFCLTPFAFGSCLWDGENIPPYPSGYFIYVAGFAVVFFQPAF